MWLSASCRRSWRASALVLFLFVATGVHANDLPWDKEALSVVPTTWEAEGFEEPGVRALFYEGVPFEGRQTRVFAWYGAPETAPGEKSPAMVLVHGGGGTAFAEWVRLWTARGYCAIAMDTCGAVPRGSYGKWERHEHGGPAGWGDFHNVDAPVGEQWPYHAVAAVVRGHSLLRSFPEVDAARIGVTGISWGGYLTCITAGVDSRFKFAAPVYGCGFLGENSTWLEVFAGMGEEKAAAWLALWDPSVYLPRAEMPFLWVTGTNDFAYPMDSLQKSYRLTKGARTLCIRIRMPHGHGGAGENPEEIHVFANAVLRGDASLPVITAQGRKDSEAWVSFAPAEKVVAAELIYTCDGGVWQDRAWNSVPAKVDNSVGRAVGAIPDNASVYYFNLVDGADLVVSSEHDTLP